MECVGKVLKVSGFERIEVERGKLQKFITACKRDSGYHEKISNFLISINLEVFTHGARVAPNCVCTYIKDWTPLCKEKRAVKANGLSLTERSLGKTFLPTSDDTAASIRSQESDALEFCRNFKRIIERTLISDISNNNI